MTKTRKEVMAELMELRVQLGMVKGQLYIMNDLGVDVLTDELLEQYMSADVVEMINI